MKYFARIDKQTVGPLSLTQLVTAGVRPSTYIWRKGMPDWIQASEDPEICRALRRYLAGMDPETGLQISLPSETDKGFISPDGADTNKEVNNSVNGGSFRSIRSFPEVPDMTDYNVKPQGVSVIMALVMTFLCFPVTGIIAVFFAMRTQAHWKMSNQEGLTPEQRADCRRKSHDDARLYRMMIGITFSIGLIIIGLAFSRSFL